jgi:hypothetical protein
MSECATLRILFETPTALPLEASYGYQSQEDSRNRRRAFKTRHASVGFRVGIVRLGERCRPPNSLLQNQALWSVLPSAQAVLRTTWMPLLPAWPGLPPMQVRRSTSIEGSGASHPAPPKSRVKKPFCSW